MCTPFAQRVASTSLGMGHHRTTGAADDDGVMGTTLNLAQSGKNGEYAVDALVFEGGGAKGIAYCGACQVLEDKGILPRCTRFAGTSAGSLTAALLALGYSAAEMTEALFKLDYRAVFQQWNTVDTDKDAVAGRSVGVAARKDYRFVQKQKNASDNLVKRTAKKVWRTVQYGLLAVRLAPRVWNGYGLSYGSALEKALGDFVETKGFPRTLTLKELFELTGKELCVVAVNVNTMSVEYLHPKTYPHVTIVEAVRMSTSFPPFFTPPKHPGFMSSENSLFVDGGVLCNYPIHAFDGWFLSTKPEDSIVRRVGGISNFAANFADSERFRLDRSAPYTSLGFKLVSAGEDDIGTTYHPLVDPSALEPAPATALLERHKRMADPSKNSLQLRRAQLQEFLLLIEGVVRADHQTIDTVLAQGITSATLFAAFEGGQTPTRLLTLEQVRKIFDEVDVDRSGKMHLQELLSYLHSAKSGFEFSDLIYGSSRKECKSFVSFLSALLGTVQFNVQVLSSNPEDGRRTIVIPTGYIQTLDLTLEKADKEFLYQCGRKAATERLAGTV